MQGAALVNSEKAGLMLPDTAVPALVKTPDLAEELADALVQLADLVRTQPLLARTVCWDLGRLSGGVLDVRARAELLTAAKDLGIEAIRMRRTGAGREAVTLKFGRRGDVRVSIGVEEAAVAVSNPDYRPRRTERPTVFVPDMDTAK